MHELLTLETEWLESDVGFGLPLEVMSAPPGEITIQMYPGVAYLMAFVQNVNEDGLLELQAALASNMKDNIVGSIPEHIPPALRVMAMAMLIAEFVEHYLGREHIAIHGFCYMTIWYEMLKGHSLFDDEGSFETWWLFNRAEFFKRLSATGIPIPDVLQEEASLVMNVAANRVTDELLTSLCVDGGEVV